MERGSFEKNLSSTEKRKQRRTQLNMGIDAVRKSNINIEDKEILQNAILGSYLTVEITESINDIFSPRRLEKVNKFLEKKSKPRQSLLSRAKEIFHH